jgi:hypothetical protein
MLRFQTAALGPHQRRTFCGDATRNFRETGRQDFSRPPSKRPPRSTCATKMMDDWRKPCHTGSSRPCLPRSRASSISILSAVMVSRSLQTVSVCCRAAPIAASMAVLGPGSDRPAAARPAAQRRTVAAGFFASRGMPPFGGSGKKPAEPLREGDRGAAVPRGLIRPFEVAYDAPINGLRDHHECCHRAGTKDIAIPIVQRPTPAQKAKAPPKGKP